MKFKKIVKYFLKNKQKTSNTYKNKRLLNTKDNIINNNLKEETNCLA